MTVFAIFARLLMLKLKIVQMITDQCSDRFACSAGGQLLCMLCIRQWFIGRQYSTAQQPKKVQYWISET